MKISQKMLVKVSLKISWQRVDKYDHPHVLNFLNASE